MQARIGETVAEFEPGKPTETKDSGHGYWTLIWKGKRIQHSGLFHHGRAVAEEFSYRDGHDFIKDKEARKFLEPYGTLLPDADATVRGDSIIVLDMFDPDTGEKKVVLDYQKTKSGAYMLRIVGAAVYAKAHPEPTPAPQVAPVEVAPEPASLPVATPDRRDCAVVATENLKRLQPISYWATILMFDYTVDGKTVPTAHAMCAWKVNKDSQVMVVDSNGALELPTTSTDSQVILTVLGSRYSKQYGKTIVTKGHSSDDGTVSKSVNDSSLEKVGKQLGALVVCAGLIGLYVWLVIICFLKGKPVFGIIRMFTGIVPFAGWCLFCGSIRIAKPNSRWARKHYIGDNAWKMAIALSRFPDLSTAIASAEGRA